MSERVGQRFEVIKTALLSLLYPLVGVVVAVEDNSLMLGEHVSDERTHGCIDIFSALELYVELAELLGNHCVEHVVGAADVESRTESAELKLVAGECKRRCAVSVGGVLLEVGKHLNACFHSLLAVADIVLAVDDCLYHFAEVVAEINRHNSGRCLVSAESVVVARGGYGGPEQILVFVDSLYDSREEKLEGDVVLGVLTGTEEVLAEVCAERPVVVLTRAVNAGKGLFVEQAYQTVLFGGFLHDLHCQLVVVVSDIRGCKDGSELVL